LAAIHEHGQIGHIRLTRHYSIGRAKWQN
jgi:hypothetical protein